MNDLSEFVEVPRSTLKMLLEESYRLDYLSDAVDALATLAVAMASERKEDAEKALSAAREYRGYGPIDMLCELLVKNSRIRAELMFDHIVVQLPEWIEAEKPESYVYFLRRPDGAIKIGRTRNLQLRMAILTAQSGHPLVLMGTVKGGSQEERKLHIEFASSRQHGEWFSSSEALLSRIKQLSTNTELLQ